ncbi:MAG: ROK family protein [Saprospiraceae bacterium]|nr:ROK family protein [Saprospiraceae bacterium]
MNESDSIVFDVGGTSIKSGIVRSDSEIIGDIRQTFIDSKADQETILSTFKGILKAHFEELGAKHPAFVAIAFPGPFDYPNGISKIKGVQKYESIYDLNLKAVFQSYLPDPGIPIFFCNDAEAAITGEARYGCGKAYHKSLGVTLGTGLGGAFMVDDVPQRTGKGVTADGEIYYFKFKGQIGDDVFSKRGLHQRFEEAGIEIVSIEAAAAAARAGDDDKRAIFEQFGTDFGIFLSQITKTFEPEAILALGGIANAVDLFRKQVEAIIHIPFVKGLLGQRAALLGAAALARIQIQS